jgi:gluconokinase
MVILIMGVSGCGKTTVGERLAVTLGLPFQEGDALHPPANIAKMAGGTALTDADRWPWLEAVAAWMDERRAIGSGGIISCSALKRAYRERLRSGRPDVELVFLRGSRAAIANRLAARAGHFMPPRLLDSQLDALEEPEARERPIVVGIEQTVPQIVEEILAGLSTRPR